MTTVTCNNKLLYKGVIKIYDVIMDSFIKESIDETHSTCIIKTYHVVKMRLKFQRQMTFFTHTHWMEDVNTVNIDGLRLN